jgi:CBS domain-containing protein
LISYFGAAFAFQSRREGSRTNRSARLSRIKESSHDPDSDETVRASHGRRHHVARRGGHPAAPVRAQGGAPVGQRQRHRRPRHRRPRRLRRRHLGDRLRPPNANVTGAPVIDGLGVCVGVISATDFVHLADAERRHVSRVKSDCVCSEWQVVEVENLPNDEVRDYMTPDPVTVRPSIRLTELARKMLDAHIHRLIVVDAQGRPVGVVSSTDVLAAVAYAEHTN